MYYNLPSSKSAWVAAIFTGEKSTFAKYFNCERAVAAYTMKQESK